MRGLPRTRVSLPATYPRKRGPRAWHTGVRQTAQRLGDRGRTSSRATQRHQPLARRTSLQPPVGTSARRGRDGAREVTHRGFPPSDLFPVGHPREQKLAHDHGGSVSRVRAPGEKWRANRVERAFTPVDTARKRVSQKISLGAAESAKHADSRTGVYFRSTRSPFSPATFLPTTFLAIG